MSTPENALRASDREREHVVTRLREAVGEGRLTLAEADERIGAAYAAVHRTQLAPLTHDLPDPAHPDAAHHGHARRSGLAGRTPRRPPLPAVLGLLLLVAWIASPLPFPWPVLLVVFLLARRRDLRARHRPT